MSLFTNSILYILINLVYTDQIWYNNMDSGNGWTQSNAFSVSGYSSSNCGSQQCVSLQGNGEIQYNGLNTSNYHNIQLQYYIKVSGYGPAYDTTPSDTCTVSYSIGQSVWTDLKQYNSSHNYVQYNGETMSMNNDANNQSTLSIRFKSFSNFDEDCYIDEIYLLGQPSTTSPTSDPTNYPTLNTLTPTLYPTLYTTYPTYPTLSPSLNPTLNPILSPSLNPTVYPTYIPTNIPTMPTVEPTAKEGEAGIYSPDIGTTVLKNVFDNNSADNSTLHYIIISAAIIIVFILVGASIYLKRRKIDTQEPGASTSVEMKSRAPEPGISDVVSSNNEQDKKFENIENTINNYTNEGNNYEKENEKKNNKHSIQTDGRWYSPPANKNQEDDDIYSDEINGVEPIIKKEDKWKHAWFMDKTPQHEEPTHNENNKQTITMGNNSNNNNENSSP